MKGQRHMDCKSFVNSEATGKYSSDPVAGGEWGGGGGGEGADRKGGGKEGEGGGRGCIWL